MLTVKLAENAGFGFDRMNKGWRTFSNSLPEYTAEKDFFVVKFFFNPNITQPDNKTNNKTNNKTSNETNKTNNETNNNIGHIEEYVKMLLGLMTNNPKITIRQLEKQSGLTKSGVEWRINLLKKKGIITRSGSAQSGKWEILQLNGFLWSGENLKEEATKTRVKTEPKLGKKLGDGSVKTVVESSDKTVGETVGETVEKTVVEITKFSEKIFGENIKNWEEVKKLLLDKLTVRLGDTEWKILAMINSDNTISTTQMAKNIHMSKIAVYKNIKKLKFKKILRREGNPKSGLWQINCPK